MLGLRYPLLYRFSRSKRVTINETWNDVNKFWDLMLGRNLKGNELTESAELNLDLASLYCQMKQTHSHDLLALTGFLYKIFDDGHRGKRESKQRKHGKEITLSH